MLWISCWYHALLILLWYSFLFSNLILWGELHSNGIIFQLVSCSNYIIFNWYHNYLISCIDFDDLLAILSNFIPTLYCLSPFFMMSKRGRKLLSMKRGRLDKHEKSFEKWMKVQKGEKNVKYFYLKERISKKKKFWKF